MPRKARAVEAGLLYHVLNRGNARLRRFRKDEDFAAFERITAEGLEQYPVDLLTYCLMGHHWHMVLRPRTDEALGRLMGWLGVPHLRRHPACVKRQVPPTVQRRQLVFGSTFGPSTFSILDSLQHATLGFTSCGCTATLRRTPSVRAW
jgi:putative transposase